jgi:hypothetical protein
MRLLCSLSLFVVTASAASAQSAGDTASSQGRGEMRLVPATAVQWQDGPASLAKGAKMAMLEGDAAQPGVFTMRLRFPDGFQVLPHWHTQVEHMTVIAGVLNLGMGERFDRTATRKMPAGSFGYWPAGTRHFAWAEGETILQLHGQGPRPVPSCAISTGNPPRHWGRGLATLAARGGRLTAACS